MGCAKPFTAVAEAERTELGWWTAAGSGGGRRRARKRRRGEPKACLLLQIAGFLPLFQYFGYAQLHTALQAAPEYRMA
jgi:hypothetical protein